MERLRQLKLPCIMHWDLNHSVVLAKVGKKNVTILEPAFGKRELSFALRVQAKKSHAEYFLSPADGRVVGLGRSMARS